MKDRVVKGRARKDKRGWQGQMGIETETYTENGRTKELCRTAGKKAPSRGGVTTVKNKRGETTKDKNVRL